MGLETLFELEPVKRLDELERRVERLDGLVDWVDVPDSPMGKPSISAPVISAWIRARAKYLGVIPHIRVVDHNLLAIKSITKTLALLGVNRVVYLRGDPVPDIKGGIAPEEALGMARKYGLSPGLIISMRRSVEEISERLSRGPDFALLLNLDTRKIDSLKQIRRGHSNVRLYPYVVLRTSRNRKVLSKVTTLTLSYDEALELVSASKPYIDGVLVSSPGDFEGGLKLVSMI